MTTSNKIKSQKYLKRWSQVKIASVKMSLLSPFKVMRRLKHYLLSFDALAPRPRELWRLSIKSGFNCQFLSITFNHEHRQFLLGPTIQ